MSSHGHEGGHGGGHEHGGHGEDIASKHLKVLGEMAGKGAKFVAFHGGIALTLGVLLSPIAPVSWPMIAGFAFVSSVGFSQIKSGHGGGHHEKKDDHHAGAHH